MNNLHTTPAILEVANFSLLRALIYTLENKGLINSGDIQQLGKMAASMAERTVNEDPASALGASQLIETWISSSFGPAKTPVIDIDRNH